MTVFFITKCDRVYYKLRQVLQSAMDLLQIAIGITKCDDYYKLRQYSPLFLEEETEEPRKEVASPVRTNRVKFDAKLGHVFS